jgi:hypothetical protein
VAQVFYILDTKNEKKHIVVPGKQQVLKVENVEDEEEYNQFDEVPFFVDTKRINIVEIKISYSNVIPYAPTDGEGKLSCLLVSMYSMYLLSSCYFSVTWILCH